MFGRMSFPEVVQVVWHKRNQDPDLLRHEILSFVQHSCLVPGRWQSCMQPQPVQVHMLTAVLTEAGYDELFFLRFKIRRVSFEKLHLPFGNNKYMVSPDENLS